MRGHQRGIQPTRRHLMKGAAATGFAASTAFSLPMTPARAEGPTRGGSLRVGSGHGSTTDSTDPTTWENDASKLMALATNNYLTMIDENNQLTSELAEDWSSNADATNWTFKIRPGIEYHNGRTVTAEDARAVLDHHRGPDSTSPAAGVLTSIVATKAEGDKLVVELSSPNADFPVMLTYYNLAIRPVMEDGRPDPSGIGAGAYVLQEYEPGIRAYMTRNPNYWRDDEGWVDEAEVLTITDPSARQSALSTGQVDIIDRVDPKIADLLQGTDGIEVSSNPTTLHYTLPMRTDTAPFDDNNVRLALKHALDRADIVDKILRGHGTIGNDQPISPIVTYADKNLSAFPYDPEKARHYLRQAGLESLQVNLSASDAAFVGAVDLAVLYKEHAAPAGIEINVVREASDGYWNDVWMQVPWSACYWGGYPTEDLMFSVAYASGVPWNDTYWSNDRFDELLAMGRAETDASVRREIYSEMQTILMNEGGVVVPVFPNNIDARAAHVMHRQNVASNHVLDGARCIQRWWVVESAA